MSKRLSHSAVSMYSQCGRKYAHHYVKKIRPNYISGALIFGNALDRALNQLIETKDLEGSLKFFKKSFSYGELNGEKFYVPYSKQVVYSKKDFDKDLITPEQDKKYRSVLAKYEIPSEGLIADYEAVAAVKADRGIKALSSNQRFQYALTNYLSLLAKGQVMLESYGKKILPRLKTVYHVQKVINSDLGNGKTLYGYIDLIAQLDDGKTYILDNKTSSMEYASDAASRSQQLIAYYHSMKNELTLDGVGFIVIYKQLLKNRVKVCNKCGFNGSGGRHKTCSNVIEGARCPGEWKETISPEARIECILDGVEPLAEALVVDTFRQAADGIDKGVFNPNLAACKVNDDYFCPYINLCWKNKMDDLVSLETPVENHKKTE